MTAEAMVISSEFRSGPVMIEATVEFEDNPSNLGPSYACGFLLQDLFLVLNLAMPGSCDFHLAEFKFRQADYPHELDHLSNYHFDVAQLFGLNGKWPVLSKLDLKLVFDWLEAIGDTSTLTAKNANKKIAYALLKFGKGEVNETDVIWVFYVFETLFKTKPGENLQALNERISLLLNLDEKTAAHLKKQLRILYDFRSALVHGGFEILNPDYFNILHDADEKERQFRHQLEFGIALCIACVQNVIQRGWRDVDFEQRLVGVPTTEPNLSHRTD